MPGNSGNSWHANVVQPCVDVVSSFLSEEEVTLTITKELNDVRSQSCVSRDLWSQYVCEVCMLLRGDACSYFGWTHIIWSTQFSNVKRPQMMGANMEGPFLPVDCYNDWPSFMSYTLILPGSSAALPNKHAQPKKRLF